MQGIGGTYQLFVAPRAGAWIETFAAVLLAGTVGSPLVQGRGLKLINAVLHVAFCLQLNLSATSCPHQT